MAACPNCGVSTRVVPNAMWLQPVIVVRPLGSHSLPGSQMKASANEHLRLFCRCGWSIAAKAIPAAGAFVGLPETQVWPDGPPSCCRVRPWYLAGPTE